MNKILEILFAAIEYAIILAATSWFISAIIPIIV